MLGVLQHLGAAVSIKVFVALGLAWVASIMSLLGLHKDRTLNRITSFLVLLKQQLDQGCFLPAYRGWEDALANLHYCERMKCGAGGGTGRPPRCVVEGRTLIRHIPLRSRGMGQTSLFSSLLMASYLLVYGAALTITVAFLLGDGIANVGQAFVLALAAMVFTVALVIAVGVGSCWVFFGRWSVIASYYTWERLLNRCVPFHPNRLQDS